MTNAVETITQNLPISEDQKQQISDKAGQVTQQMTEQVSGTVTSQIGNRATQAAEQASTVAEALRASGQKLQEQGQDGPARMVHMAADRADQVGTYLSSSDPNQILADVEDFCRQQPWVVIAGGIALGFLGARFLKSSSTKRYESYQGQAGPYGYVSSGYNPGTYSTGYDSQVEYAPGYVSGTGYATGTSGYGSQYESDEIVETYETGGI